MATAIDKVVTAWLNGRTCKMGNLSTDGRILYSYNAPIGIRKAGDVYILKAGEYSVTTSKHCNQAARECFVSFVTCISRVSKTELKDTIEG